MSEKICFAMIRFALVFLIAACQEYQIQEIKEVMTPGPMTIILDNPNEDFPFHKQFNTPDGPYDLGDPLFPDIELNFQQHDFGTHELGSPPTSVILEISNLGDYHLNIWSIKESCTSTSYSHTLPANTTILPGYSESMLIQYTASTYGDDSCTYTVESDDPDEGILIVQATGRGAIPDLLIQPSSLVFGAIDIVNTPSRTMTVMLENQGDGEVLISGIAKSKKSTDIDISSYPVFALSPGQSTTMDVTYTPSDRGTDNEDFTILSNDPYKNSQVVTVTGETANPTIVVNPDLDFGTLELGSNLVKTFDINNTGTGTLSLGGVYFQNATSAFSIVTSYTGDIKPGSFAQIEIKYEPDDYVPDVAYVDIISNDPVNPVVTVNLLGEAGVPQISVSPLSIDYGNILVGNSAQQTVVIDNLGNGTLAFSNISLNIGNDYSIKSPVPQTIAPNSQATLDIEYIPIAYGWTSDTLVIDSNDPYDPSVLVSIQGKGSAPQIEISPDPYDFGYEYLECSREAVFDLKNVGDIDLLVNNVEYFTSFPNHFTIDYDTTVNGNFPWVIPPGSFNSVFVEYEPMDVTNDSSFIKVHSNDPTTPTAYAYQAGQGDYYSSTTDTFLQSNLMKSDILFVIDNSCSMGTWQTHVANNFDSFMNVFQNSGIDYHIAVITTDSPYFVGPVIDTQTTDPVKEMETQVRIGTGGSGHEQGLDQAYFALRPNGSAAPGSSFLRVDAKLSIIFVSDEPDYSNSFLNKLDYIPEYEKVKSNSALVVAHAIAGDFPGGCSYYPPGQTWSPSYAVYGRGYYEVVNDMGGTFLSICDSDWGLKMETLAKGSLIKTSFELTDNPVANTIEVYVDAIVENNWVYDSVNNSIEFDSLHIPPIGSIVEITYNIYGGCP